MSKTFIEVFPTSDDFINGFPSAYEKFMKDSTGNLIVPMDILYLLLTSKYGSWEISGSETFFTNRTYALIFQYGPTWARSLGIQDELRKMTDVELMKGTTQVNDHAYNPSTVIEGGPNPDSGEIETTNEQTRTKYKKSKMDAYSNLMILLQRDVTEDFLNRFRYLFKIVINAHKCKGDEEEGE